MIMTSGILARDMTVKEVVVRDKTLKVLNNCIFVKGRGEKDIPINITAWDTWAEYIAVNYKKGDTLHVIADEAPENFKVGEKSITIVGLTVRAVVTAEAVNTGGAFLRELAIQLQRNQTELNRYLPIEQDAPFYTEEAYEEK